MKRVCFFCGNINLPGGTERVAAVIASGLVDLGYDVWVLSLSNGDQPFFSLNAEIHIDRIFEKKISARLGYPLVVAKLRRFVLENRIDVLINVEAILTAFSVPALLGTHVRSICWEHLNYKNDLGRSIRRVARHLAALFADDVVTLTNRDKTEWLKRTWMRANVRAIFNPIPFAFPETVAKVDSKIVLAVGRMAHVKGFDMLLAAWANVVKHDLDGWRLKIVGDGEEKTRLENLRDELGLAETVTLCPATNDINEYYQNASLYCLSSRQEGLPMVLIEAQSHGLPVVAFDCETGPREIIADNETGILVESGNVDALGEAMLGLMRDPGKRRKFSEEARVSALRFAPSQILDQWVKLIEQ